MFCEFIASHPSTFFDIAVVCMHINTRGLETRHLPCVSLIIKDIRLKCYVLEQNDPFFFFFMILCKVLLNDALIDSDKPKKRFKISVQKFFFFFFFCIQKVGKFSKYSSLLISIPLKKSRPSILRDHVLHCSFPSLNTFFRLRIYITTIDEFFFTFFFFFYREQILYLLSTSWKFSRRKNRVTKLVFKKH